ncbi:unnamed protein product [Amoebophrya sp. A120]|nr:unnamed protein product [Amoebophrya sp. A120]|eukprot:GSA120T00000010001.1
MGDPSGQADGNAEKETWILGYIKDLMDVSLDAKNFTAKERREMAEDAWEDEFGTVKINQSVLEKDQNKNGEKNKTSRTSSGNKETLLVPLSSDDEGFLPNEMMKSGKRTLSERGATSSKKQVTYRHLEKLDAKMKAKEASAKGPGKINRRQDHADLNDSMLWDHQHEGAGDFLSSSVEDDILDPFSLDDAFYFPTGAAASSGAAGAAAASSSSVAGPTSSAKGNKSANGRENGASGAAAEIFDVDDMLDEDDDANEHPNEYYLRTLYKSEIESGRIWEILSDSEEEEGTTSMSTKMTKKRKIEEEETPTDLNKNTTKAGGTRTGSVFARVAAEEEEERQKLAALGKKAPKRKNNKKKAANPTWLWQEADVATGYDHFGNQEDYGVTEKIAMDLDDTAVESFKLENFNAVEVAEKETAKPMTSGNKLVSNKSKKQGGPPAAGAASRKDSSGANFAGSTTTSRHLRAGSEDLDAGKRQAFVQYCLGRSCAASSSSGVISTVQQSSASASSSGTTRGKKKAQGHQAEASHQLSQNTTTSTPGNSLYEPLPLTYLAGKSTALQNFTEVPPESLQAYLESSSCCNGSLDVDVEKVLKPYEADANLQNQVARVLLGDFREDCMWDFSSGSSSSSTSGSSATAGDFSAGVVNKKGKAASSSSSSSSALNNLNTTTHDTSNDGINSTNQQINHVPVTGFSPHVLFKGICEGFYGGFEPWLKEQNCVLPRVAWRVVKNKPLKEFASGYGVLNNRSSSASFTGAGQLQGGLLPRGHHQVNTSYTRLLDADPVTKKAGATGTGSKITILDPCRDDKVLVEASSPLDAAPGVVNPSAGGSPSDSVFGEQSELVSSRANNLHQPPQEENGQPADQNSVNPANIKKAAAMKKKQPPQRAGSKGSANNTDGSSDLLQKQQDWPKTQKSSATVFDAASLVAQDNSGNAAAPQPRHFTQHSFQLRPEQMRELQWMKEQEQENTKNYLQLANVEWREPIPNEKMVFQSASDQKREKKIEDLEQLVSASENAVATLNLFSGETTREALEEPLNDVLRQFSHTQIDRDQHSSRCDSLRIQQPLLFPTHFAASRQVTIDMLLELKTRTQKEVAKARENLEHFQAADKKKEFFHLQKNYPAALQQNLLLNSTSKSGGKLQLPSADGGGGGTASGAIKTDFVEMRVQGPKIRVRGGILNDQLGYGKTCLMIGLMDWTLKQQCPKRTDLKFWGERTGSHRTHRGTLVVMPPHLLAQWFEEITRFVGNDFAVMQIATLSDLKARTVADILNHDVILCNSKVFDSPGYKHRVQELCKYCNTDAKFTSFARKEEKYGVGKVSEMDLQASKANAYNTTSGVQAEQAQSRSVVGGNKNDGNYGKMPAFGSTTSHNSGASSSTAGGLFFGAAAGAGGASASDAGAVPSTSSTGNNLFADFLDKQAKQATSSSSSSSAEEQDNFHTAATNNTSKQAVHNRKLNWGLSSLWENEFECKFADLRDLADRMQRYDEVSFRFPVLELFYFRRVVADELHEAAEFAQDLQSFDTKLPSSEANARTAVRNSKLDDLQNVVAAVGTAAGGTAGGYAALKSSSPRDVVSSLSSSAHAASLYPHTYYRLGRALICLQKIRSSYRWALSGTLPLQNRMVLNQFLSFFTYGKSVLAPVQHNEQVFRDFVRSNTLANVTIPKEEKVVVVQQSKYEHAIYLDCAHQLKDDASAAGAGGGVATSSIISLSMNEKKQLQQVSRKSNSKKETLLKLCSHFLRDDHGEGDLTKSDQGETGRIKDRKKDAIEACRRKLQDSCRKFEACLRGYMITLQDTRNETKREEMKDQRRARLKKYFLRYGESEEVKTDDGRTVRKQAQPEKGSAEEIMATEIVNAAKDDPKHLRTDRDVNTLEKFQDAVNHYEAIEKEAFAKLQRAVRDKMFFDEMMKVMEKDRFECEACMDEDCTEAGMWPCSHFLCYDCAVQQCNRQQGNAHGPTCPKRCPGHVKASELCRLTLGRNEAEELLDKLEDDSSIIGKYGSKLKQIVQLLKTSGDVTTSSGGGFNTTTGAATATNPNGAAAASSVAPVALGGAGGKKTSNGTSSSMFIPAEDKVILFVQWEDLKRKIAKAFDEFGVPHLTLQGTTHQKRIIFDKFAKDDKKYRVLILSMEDAASGANLTQANHVFLVHPFFDAESEEKCLNYEKQAVGRVLRYGQKKPVKIWRFVAKNTIEEEILEDRRKAASASQETVPDDLGAGE